jgi:hypothetical protein
VRGRRGNFNWRKKSRALGLLILQHNQAREFCSKTCLSPITELRAKLTFCTLRNEFKNMTIPQPSRSSASISGLLLGLASPVLELIQRAPGLSVQMKDVLFISVIALFLFLPALLFVIGVDYLSQGARKKIQIDREIIIRVFCWFGGGALAFSVFAALN